MPLLGPIQSTGLTARELEGVIEIKLRQYMKNPHVGVFVTTVESHPVSVVGAVKKPGVFQIRGTKTVLEMLSMAEGLADDAGDQVLVMRGAGLQFGSDSLRDTTGTNPDSGPPANPPSNETIKINLKDLLESGDHRMFDRAGMELERGVELIVDAVHELDLTYRAVFLNHSVQDHLTLDALVDQRRRILRINFPHRHRGRQIRRRQPRTTGVAV